MFLLPNRCQYFKYITYTSSEKSSEIISFQYGIKYSFIKFLVPILLVKVIICLMGVFFAKMLEFCHLTSANLSAYILGTHFLILYMYWLLLSICEQMYVAKS